MRFLYFLNVFAVIKAHKKGIINLLIEIYFHFISLSSFMGFHGFSLPTDERRKEKQHQS